MSSATSANESPDPSPPTPWGLVILLGSALLALGGWQSNFWFMAAYGGVIAAAAFFRLKESRTEAPAIQASQENPFQSYWALMRNEALESTSRAAQASTPQPARNSRPPTGVTAPRNLGAPKAMA